MRISILGAAAIVLFFSNWCIADDPGHTPKRHVEEIALGHHSYSITQGGTMDGANCRSPLGVGMMDGPALEQSWESNRFVRLENVGASELVNPWLSNGRNGFRTLDEIVAAAVRPGMTDREKAQALWFQEIRHRYHWEGDNNELGDPVKVYNVYGHNTCGNDSICLAGLWRKAGLKVAPARVVGHCITQAFFDGRWNLFDGDMHSMYLLRDNQTVASEQDLVRDHDLIKRSHTQGILNPDKRANDEWEASIFVYEGAPEGTRNCKMDTNMNMLLRPGEALTWRWGHAEPVKYHGNNKPKYPGTICNGSWEYQPDFSKEHWKKGAASVENIRTTGGALTAEEGKTGAIVWTMRSPYVFVGGKLDVHGNGARFSLSWDGKTWQPAGPNLDNLFPPNGPARYEYRLRCELTGDARLESLKITNEVQMALLALPEMTVGVNNFVYSDQTPGERKVRITHEWVERDDAKPPLPPTVPDHPRDGIGVSSFGIPNFFRWHPAHSQDNHAVVDYQFELSDRPDMLWPLSPNFYKLVSKTSDKGNSEYTLPEHGLLTPGRNYFWRVKAKNDAGLWSDWSPTWRFTSGGLATPLDLKLEPDAKSGSVRLSWKPVTSGEGYLVNYWIYGSDERGFTISDGATKSTVGISKEVPSVRPSNRLTVVNDCSVLIEPKQCPDGHLLAYYRVKAAASKGDVSGPSEYVEAPRPFIYSHAQTAAQVNKPYRYTISTVRSLGDLHTRVVNGKETMNYWDIEVPRYVIEQGPAWLKIDSNTGLLSGTPAAAGKVPVVVTASIEHEVRNLDAGSLMWGVEKVLSTDRKRVGVAKQKFEIDVAQ
jgi:Putative Ig domain